MSKVSYVVSKAGEEWALSRNGANEGTYLTQEAAFEVAASSASADLRSGHSIVIEATAPTNPAGARDLGGEPMRGDGFS